MHAITLPKELAIEDNEQHNDRSSLLQAFVLQQRLISSVELGSSKPLLSEAKTQTGCAVMHRPSGKGKRKAQATKDIDRQLPRWRTDGVCLCYK